METESAPEYRLEEDGPFLRAYVKIFGRTPDAALESSRDIRTALARELSTECTCYSPVYKGFDQDARRHYAELLVGLGGDRTAAREQLARFMSQLSSSAPK